MKWRDRGECGKKFNSRETEEIKVPPSFFYLQQAEQEALISPQPTQNVYLSPVNYNQTSLIGTSSGPYKIVLDMSISSHLGLIIMSGQEANAYNLGIYF